jgi:hypothetical protein
MDQTTKQNILKLYDSYCKSVQDQGWELVFEALKHHHCSGCNCERDEGIINILIYNL